MAKELPGSQENDPDFFGLASPLGHFPDEHS